MENNNTGANTNNIPQRPTGARPAGVRPSMMQQSGTQSRPNVAVPNQNQSQQQASQQRVQQPARPVSTQPRPAGAPGQSTQSVRPAGVQQSQVRQQVHGAQSQQSARTNSVQQRVQPTPVTGKTVSESTGNESHVIKNSKTQRVIESKHIDFQKNPNLKDYVLYVIIDKPVDGMLQYFRSYGLNVSKIFSRIDDARNALMMQVNPAKIVIVDTGNGAFNSMSARKQVIDIIGLGDEENKVIIFYSDTNLKSEIEASKEIQKKALTWYKYKTTAHLLACMLQSKDCNYIHDGGYSDASPVVANLDETLWKNINFKATEEHTMMPIINCSDVAKLVHDTGSESIPGFKPVIK